MDFAQRISEADRIARIVAAQAARLRAVDRRIAEIEAHCERIRRGEESPAPPDAEDD